MERLNNNRFFFYVILSVVVILVIIVLSGFLFYRSIFYDQWIWRYYWGPVVADARGHPVTYNNVTAYEGYTLVSELTYGLILVVSILGVYRLLKRLRVEVNWFFCLSLIPYIIYGSTGRVLEDTSYLHEPFVYWFISPFIYLQVAFYALFFLVLGYMMSNVKPVSSSRSQLICVSSLLLIMNVTYTSMCTLGVDYGAYILHPLEFLFLSILGFTPFYYKWLKHSVTVNVVVFSGGLLFLSPSLYLILRWLLMERWSASTGIRFDVFILVTLLVSLIILLVYILVSYISRIREVTSVYKAPLNLLMMQGHILDGLSSYISIYDPFGMGVPSYIEKHPVSSIVLETWPPLYPLMKFILIIILIYFFDVLYKKELARYINLVNLLKIGVFILGFSPGLRDLLRVTLGV